MTRRTEFTRTTKLAAWNASGGKCADCEREISPGTGPEYDHAIPCELGGDNSLGNCVVLCIACHKAKTAKLDMPAIVKTRSVQAGYVNAKTRRNPLPGSKGSGFRKKMDGTVLWVKE
jgi:5-methylcytosine-specific restriction endonuclease McrA